MFKKIGNMTRQCALAGALALCCAHAVADEVAAMLRRADAFRLPDASAQVDTLVQSYQDGRLDKERRYQVLIRPGGRALVLFRSPGEAGQKVLMVGDDFWMLLPGSARPIRITPLQKLLGEAATGDIATMTWSGDYSGVIAGEAMLDGVPCLELELSALRPSLSYQRIVLRVARRDGRPLQADLYAASQRKLKQARFVLELRDGRQVVTRMTLVDAIGHGRETVVSTVSTRPRQLGDELFNPMFLGRADLAP